MLKIEEARKILDKYDQSHLLNYYDDLSESEKLDLLTQIEMADFSVLKSLKKDGGQNSERGHFEPLSAFKIEEIEQKKDDFTNAGINAIKGGKAAAVLLAGGQGTRLGYDKPKGMYNIGITRNLSIFECLINNLLEVVELADAWIPFYIMTSVKNYSETVKFFRENNYFGYNSNYIRFFSQDMAPSTDFNGKILMESKSEISADLCRLMATEAGFLQ